MPSSVDFGYFPKTTATTTHLSLNVGASPSIVVPSNADGTRLSFLVTNTSETEVLLLNFNNHPLTTAIFSIPLKPLSVYVDDVFQGQMRAISKSGNPIKVVTTEFINVQS